MSQNVNRQQDFLLALGAFAVAFILWQFRPLSPVVYPLRLFVTFIHELGHGVAAILTGGEFLHFEVFDTGAGRAFFRGGVREIVWSAGYVGTAAFGATLLILANRGVKFPRYVAGILGLSFALLTLLFAGLGLENFNVVELALVLGVIGVAGFLYAREMRTLAFTFIIVSIVAMLFFAAGDNTITVTIGVLSGVLLVVLSRYGSRELIIFVLNFLAFAVGLNAITDALTLFEIVSSDLVLHNDATFMEGATDIPASVWAFSWIVLAIILMGGALWLTFIRPLRKSHDS